ncbi:S1 RNA-binding domain-containing protein [Candidatus Woesearchaeota archaeon]|nr:S1 RNA-binding domain-containing protein [Candidatus Woesearchaeota archaeon]
MLLKKQGLPQEDELVLCTVTAIQYHSVFITLDEYNNRTGMIHISEIAPGRIRNIHDFVKEGKKVVCLVLRINKEKGHIDLSLRRVNESQKREKLNQIKQEQLAESIIQNVARQLKIDTIRLYDDLSKKLLQEHAGLYDVFESVSVDEVSLEKKGVDKKIAKILTEVIIQRIKPTQVQIGGVFNLSTYASNGVDLICSILKNAQTPETKILYTGAGLYNLTIISNDYKKAESCLKKIVDSTLDAAKKLHVKAEFKKQEI